MTSLLLLLIATPLVLAEPMLYMFPTNPELHPQSMYPNQQFMRGKVRDLPDSGVIYLKRIRPIEDEAIKGSVVELSVEKISQNSNDHQTPIPTSFERYNSEEERMSPRVTTTTTAPVEQLQRVPERKIHAEKQAFQKSKPVQLTVPEEAELDIILGDLMKNDNMKMKMDKSKLPRVGKRGSKRHVGGVAPKVISFDGTALVDKRHAKASPVSVKFHPRKLYRSSPTNTQNQGPDFDPWERMGQ